jgi:hypothetical protein
MAGASRGDRVYGPANCVVVKVAMTLADQLFEQAKLLPEPLAREALDFVLFLRARYERPEWRDLMNAQGAALAETWDNEADEAWNHI